MPSICRQSDRTPGGRCAGLGLIILLLLTSCTQGVVRQPFPVPHQAGFSSAGQNQLPEQWWETFEDPVLDRLIDRALSGNLDLRIAWDRLDRASALARMAAADRWPQANGEAAYTASRSRADSRTDSTRLVSLGLSASYEIDLWGRIDATERAAALDAAASAEDLQTAALTLSAEVATTWFQLLEQDGQIEILREQLRTNQQVLELIDLQFRTGQVGVADLLQQRQVVETRRGDLALATGRARVLRNRLAVLLGDTPDQVTQLDAGAFGTLPPLPATGLQSNLLERRPDVRSAWLRLHAADQQVAAAVADRFPRLSLTGRASTSSERIEQLFDDWLASLAAGLLAPLVDGGRRRAEVERTRADASAALHSYGQTVLDAFAEVEDALAREQSQVEYLASIDRQLQLAEQSTARIRDRYLNGAENYLRVLTALLSEQLLQRTRLSAHSELFVNRVNLCRALAGGWQLQRPTE